MEQHVTISRESLDTLFSAACSFYAEVARSGIRINNDEECQTIIKAIKEAATVLGKGEDGMINVWLVGEH